MMLQLVGSGRPVPAPASRSAALVAAQCAKSIQAPLLENLDAEYLDRQSSDHVARHDRRGCGSRNNLELARCGGRSAPRGCCPSTALGHAETAAGESTGLGRHGLRSARSGGIISVQDARARTSPSVAGLRRLAEQAKEAGRRSLSGAASSPGGPPHIWFAAIAGQ